MYFRRQMLNLSFQAACVFFLFGESPSFNLASVELTKRLLEGMTLAAFAVSLGGVESIISYPAKMSHAAMPPVERKSRGISDTLVRLSVGLEDADDLIGELDRLLNG